MCRQIVWIVLVSMLVIACGSQPPTPTPEPPAMPTAPQEATQAVTEEPSPTATTRPEPTQAAPQEPSPTMVTPPEPAEPPPPADPATFEPQVEVVASNLEVPWGIAFAPDGRILFTERPGRIRAIVNGELQPQPLADFALPRSGEGGLMGLVLDPAFEGNGYLYVMYTYRDGLSVNNRISRLTLQEGRAGDEQVLLEGIPGSTIHDGGRLSIGPDGKLYATTGDASNRSLAQDLDSLAGKILRMNLDGSVPDDNPFAGSLVYSYGHRNPQGLTWQPGTGQLFSTEHGPSGEMGLCCRDEMNLIQPGGNYGWPEVTLAAGDPRFVDPILNSGANTTWAPASAAIYGGDLLAPWRGNLFFGALRGQHLHRVVLGGPDRAQVVEHERLWEGAYGRIRTVVTGPDGALYFMTSNRDGRGRPAPDDDRILRITVAGRAP